MNKKKFCRFSSECGKNENCLGTFFGLKKGNCSSNKGKCRFNKNCPKYYQCVDNYNGLTTGKCLLAISKNPMSKSMAGVSSSLVDPASKFRNAGSVNKTMLVMMLIIISGIVYVIYSITGPIQKQAGGACLTSYDCTSDAAIPFQCGVITGGYSLKPGKPIPIAVKPNVCDCTTVVGGAVGSAASSVYCKPFHDVENPTPTQESNCRLCPDGAAPIYKSTNS